MASWFIFCNLGLCPNAGQDFYYLNAPLVSDAVIRMSGNRKLRITANASEENVYIKSLKVNGKPWNSAILPHSEIASGGLMEFELSSEPSSSSCRAPTRHPFPLRHPGPGAGISFPNGDCGSSPQ